MKLTILFTTLLVLGTPIVSLLTPSTESKSKLLSSRQIAVGGDSFQEMGPPANTGGSSGGDDNQGGGQPQVAQQSKPDLGNKPPAANAANAGGVFNSGIAAGHA